MQEYYTVSQVAKMLGIHRVTVWRLIKAGKIKAIDLAGKKRIHKSELKVSE